VGGVDKKQGTREQGLGNRESCYLENVVMSIASAHRARITSMIDSPESPLEELIPRFYP
jgi:hypothetical protein